MARKGYDETKLRPGQREAGLLLVEREFATKENRKTKQQIAEEVGVTYQCLWKWDTQDSNFIAYKNSLSADFMDSHLSLVYSKLIDVIKQGNTKGIELFLKRHGDLDSKSEVTIKDSRDEDKSFEERQAELLERLNGDKEEEEE